MTATGPGGALAVIDHGKTNVRVLVLDPAGRVIGAEGTPNLVRPGPPWRHHDLAALSGWVFAALARLAARHGVRAVVPAGHGSGGVLVTADPDAGGDGAALPMPDYEEPFPPPLDALYRPLAGGFLDRGSAVMMASTHQARQLFRMQAEAPQAVAGAAHYLSVPQYWAWRLSGVAVSEFSTLGAQSHLWNVADRVWTPIVRAMGWGRLLPPPVPSHTALGTLRPGLAARYGMPPGMTVFAGGHDSSLNFHRYRAAGLSGLTLVSTGTWIVAMSDGADPTRLDEARGMTLNSDTEGRPVGGALNMGGRAFAMIAGKAGAALAATDPAEVAAAVKAGTMALPSFTPDDGQFPGSGRQGRIVGPDPATPAARRSVAALYAALLTEATVRALGATSRVVLDGTFLSDPLYAPLVAALLPATPVFTSRETAGVAAGAAMLARRGEGSPADVPLDRAATLAVPGLPDYAESWRRFAEGAGGSGAETTGAGR
ncbi:MAG: FGGY family carbohydrate kinase [Paracoccaceae bacterium]